MARNRTPSPRYVTARRHARLWALSALVALIAAVPLWFAAYYTGFGASPYHALFEVVALLAFAATFAVPFALWGWIEYADKAERYA